MTDINVKPMAVYSAIGAAGAWIAELFGGWTDDVITLIIFMAIDYIMGLVCAAVFKKSDKTPSGALSSKVCWAGLAKKIAILCFVLIAQRLDLMIGTDYIRTAVVIAFCASELISICENAGLMGIPLPEVIKKAIDILKNKSGDDKK